VELLRDVDDQQAALALLDDDRVRRRVQHVFTEIDRVRQAARLVDDGDFEGVGATFVASHASLRDDYEVSCPELDVVVEVAMAQGALGARMTGGGFGGSAIALVREDDVERVADAVADAYGERGWRSPGFLTALPGDGAREVE
jgi:galactokinase